MLTPEQELPQFKPDMSAKLLQCCEDVSKYTRRLISAGSPYAGNWATAAASYAFYARPSLREQEVRRDAERELAIYKQMVRDAVRDIVAKRPAIRTYVGPHDVDVDAEIARRYAQVAAQHAEKSEELK